MSSLSLLGLIFFGGGLGSLARFAVSKGTLQIFDIQKFPMGTIVANFLACLILGLTIYLFKDKLLENEWIKYFVIIGFCGGFSTFSTFSLESVRLIQDQFYALAALNILISLALGMGILFLLVRQ